MNFIIDNWYIILTTFGIIVTTSTAVYFYFKLPSESQLTKVREWLLWAVTGAEKELGGGTGKLKLRQVYDLFVTRFPWLAKVLSFQKFSDMVDDALDEMRKMLESNKAVRNLVEGGGTNDTH